MADYRRIELHPHDDITIVRFLDPKVIEAKEIQELGDELYQLADEHSHLLLNFFGVEFLSSGALNKLIILNNKVKTRGGSLRLCELRPEIAEVFQITRLNKLFDIYEDEKTALQAI